MENITDALYMGTAVLIFIVALTVGISSFSSVKTEVESMVNDREAAEMATDSSGRYLNYIQVGTDVRIVDASTVISSIRRVREESYTIYISFKDNTIDSLSDILYDTTSRKTAVKQVYDTSSNVIIPENKKILEISLTNDKNIDKILCEQFYKKIKDKRFNEYLGTYQNKNVTSSANKLTYRIITFVEI